MGTPLEPQQTATLKRCFQRAGLVYSLRGKIRGCNTRTLLHYKAFIRPVMEYFAIILDLHTKTNRKRLICFERRLLQRFLQLPWRYSSDQVYVQAQFSTISERIELLQKKFVQRTIANQNPTSIPTLLHALGPLPRKPYRNRWFPPAVLLQTVHDLPVRFQDFLENLQLNIRYRVLLLFHTADQHQDDNIVTKLYTIHILCNLTLLSYPNTLRYVSFLLFFLLTTSHSIHDSKTLIYAHETHPYNVNT